MNNSITNIQEFEVNIVKNYKPPFIITSKIVDYISSIMEKIGKLDNYTNFNKMSALRKNNRIRSI